MSDFLIRDCPNCGSESHLVMTSFDPIMTYAIKCSSCHLRTKDSVNHIELINFWHNLQISLYKDKKLFEIEDKRLNKTTTWSNDTWGTELGKEPLDKENFGINFPKESIPLMESRELSLTNDEIKLLKIFCKGISCIHSNDNEYHHWSQFIEYLKNQFNHNN